MAGFEKLLIANRGEIAVRIARAAAQLGLHSTAVYSEDDAEALPVRRADAAQALPGRGAAAYLSTEALVSAALAAGCQAVHPGYGFLSENAGFARACAAAGLVFVGPPPETLELFGDKSAARAFAARCNAPLLAGTKSAATLQQAHEFFAQLTEGGALIVKAVAGGGGRGMRVCNSPAELEAAYARCSAEAQKAFGNGALYCEEYLPRARHVEVQIIGDGSGDVRHLFERECTLQRRHQKLVEVAPSPKLSAPAREALFAAALRMAREAKYKSLGTFEFLLDAGDETRCAFIEANARLQVEHTVTEEITGLDLVAMQLQIAQGKTLAQLGFAPGKSAPPAPRGFAVQCRINCERMNRKGLPLPSTGRLRVFEPPGGPGIRVDTCGTAGYAASPAFDSLLAKLIAYSPSPNYADALARARRALGEFRIEGIQTNAGFLQALLRRPEVAANEITTRFVEENSAALAAELASATSTESAPESTEAVRAPVQGTVLKVAVQKGALVRAGETLLIMEAMKMEHVIPAPHAGCVTKLNCKTGATVEEGAVLLHLQKRAEGAAHKSAAAPPDPAHIRPDLRESIARHAYGLDEKRPQAVAKRRAVKRRTARENIAAMCDPDTFLEYGPLVLAAQRRRREVQDLIENTPGDGMVAGIGAVNGALFPAADARCVFVSYDYTVLAGTQGGQNHRKKDRLFELAEQWRLPVVLFSEGGGGRPGDSDGIGGSGLDCWAFRYFGALSGRVPLVGINAGYCFAGNAALLGCCDAVIATADSNIGMGGPAMIEGGGLGVFHPKQIGPMEVQRANGVVDIAVKDEAEATAVAKQYLGYFQGALAEWDCADPRLLRHAIPENRLRVYDIRALINLLCDSNSVLELRRDFGAGMVTALARVEGRAMGIVANNPAYLSGAITSDGADKAARFMKLCDAFEIPLLFLCDTPGIMVGPQAESTGTVRHAARMFVVGASLSVPFFTIVLRKGYGLGAQAMAGGSFKAPVFCVAWPTGEFGGMGLEGAAKLGYRKELAAQKSEAARRELYDKLVAQLYAHGKAISSASYFEIDDVIDPADSRRWISRALKSMPPAAHYSTRPAKKRPCVDTW